MPQLFRTPVLATIIVVIALVSTAGCTEAGPTWVDDGASYTTNSVESTLDKADISALVERPSIDAAKLRHDALTSLRKRGDSAARVADLLTATFDPATRAVPVYVEAATLDGKPVVIVVEATGPKTGKLRLKRLWVLDKSGSVILSRSR